MQRLGLSVLLFVALVPSTVLASEEPVGAEAEAYLKLKKEQLKLDLEATLAATTDDVYSFDSEWTANIVKLEYALPFVWVDIIGGGRATVIGDFTLQFPHMVILPLFFETGEMTLTVADKSGDHLFIQVNGFSFPTSPDLSVVRAIPYGYIRGGTGKYERASGAVLFDSTVYLNEGWVEGIWTGFITGIDQSTVEQSFGVSAKL